MAAKPTYEELEIRIQNLEKANSAFKNKFDLIPLFLLNQVSPLLFERKKPLPNTVQNNLPEALDSKEVILQFGMPILSHVVPLSVDLYTPKESIFLLPAMLA